MSNYLHNAIKNLGLLEPTNYRTPYDILLSVLLDSQKIDNDAFILLSNYRDLYE